jgi:hypothetical protein
MIPRKIPFSVVPANPGIQLIQNVLDPGACPGLDPGFAGVTTKETFFELVKINCLIAY